MLLLAHIAGCNHYSQEYMQRRVDQRNSREAIKALQLQQAQEVPYEQRIMNNQTNQYIRSMRQQRVNIYR